MTRTLWSTITRMTTRDDEGGDDETENQDGDGDDDDMLFLSQQSAASSGSCILTDVMPSKTAWQMATSTSMLVDPKAGAVATLQHGDGKAQHGDGKSESISVAHGVPEFAQTFMALPAL